MYELTSTFSMTSRQHLAADTERIREYHAENGVADLLCGDVLTGMYAGGVSWSARFATPAAVAVYMRGAINAAVDANNAYADVRARYKLVARSLNQVINDVGDRSGPHMILSSIETTCRTAVEEDRYALERLVANGATGASTTVLTPDHELTCRYSVAAHGNSFEEIETASAAGLRDKRVAAATLAAGTTLTSRIYLDII